MSNPPSPPAKKKKVNVICLDSDEEQTRSFGARPRAAPLPKMFVSNRFKDRSSTALASADTTQLDIDIANNPPSDTGSRRSYRPIQGPSYDSPPLQSSSDGDRQSIGSQKRKRAVSRIQLRTQQPSFSLPDPENTDFSARDSDNVSISSKATDTVLVPMGPQASAQRKKGGSSQMTRHNSFSNSSQAASRPGMYVPNRFKNRSHTAFALLESQLNFNSLDDLSSDVGSQPSRHPIRDGILGTPPFQSASEGDHESLGPQKRKRAVSPNQLHAQKPISSISNLETQGIADNDSEHPSASSIAAIPSIGHAEGSKRAPRVKDPGSNVENQSQAGLSGGRDKVLSAPIGERRGLRPRRPADQAKPSVVYTDGDQSEGYISDMDVPGTVNSSSQKGQRSMRAGKGKERAGKGMEKAKGKKSKLYMRLHSFKLIGHFRSSFDHNPHHCPR